MTGSANPSSSFSKTGTSSAATTVRYDTRQASSAPARVNTSSQRPLPRLEAESATNQRGQPAFFGIVYVVSVNSSALYEELPSGAVLCPARNLAPSMSASAPATRPASSARSLARCALL